MKGLELAPSAYQDHFARDYLPDQAQWPQFQFTLPELQYPPRLNAVATLLDASISAGHGDAPCLKAPGVGGAPPLAWSYAQLQERVNRIANVLTGHLGMVSGNRVLLRSANTPMLVAVYLAIIKAGGIVVASMPLLRAKELIYPLTKAHVTLALCDHRLRDDLDMAAQNCPHLKRIVSWGHDEPGSLDRLMLDASPTFAAVDTSADDVCLIGFTSGTTGQPKGTMHFHRDLMAICDAYGRHVLKARASDVFIGSPPLAFTFGLGGLVLFPLAAGASTVLLERASPDDLLPAIVQFGATICFTAPTAYRAILGKIEGFDLASLRCCVSAGEALPLATFEAWKAATGLELMDGIGATEMLHIFIAAPQGRVRPGATGLVVPGYSACILDATGNEVPRGTAGRLAVRGPTGCRYLADERQSAYVQQGWNVTGDTYLQDAEGYFWYQARSDDMIVSAGYNIAGPEVEASLLAHPAVAECGVVGQPDAERGMIVLAYVVLKPGHAGDAALTKALQDHVKADIAPFKYPRTIRFVERLPRTETGKLQRFMLRQMAGDKE
jgi:2-aminobenzoate-CoA ligase